MTQQQRYTTSFNPVQLLNSAYTTIGAQKAEALGIVRTNSGSFNFQHIKKLEAVQGNIVISNLECHVNFSQNADEVRFYGAITGLAGLNLNGQPTLRSTIPAIVMPPRKRNAQQRVAVRETFARELESCKGAMDTGTVEINPEGVHVYQKTSMQDGSSQTIVVIEAAGMFGLDNQGTPVYWSILQHPLSNFLPKPVEEVKTESKRTKSRSPRKPSAEKGSTEKPEPRAEVEVEKELVNVS